LKALLRRAGLKRVRLVRDLRGRRENPEKRTVFLGVKE